MEIHVLDFIMYIVIAIIIMICLPQDWTTEIGGLIGIFILAIYTLVYIFLFVWMDLNWSDIFNSKESWFDIKW